MNNKNSEENKFRTEIFPKQKWKGEDYDFDPDSSPKAWEHYEQYYMKNFEESDIKDKLKIDGNRLCLDLPIYKRTYTIAGDCSFNFNEKKAPKFNDMIENDEHVTKEYKTEMIKELEKCKVRHYSLLNFDLMPRTGAMNAIKGKLKYKNGKVMVNSIGGNIQDPTKFPMDRLDTFIYFLDYSFQRIDELKRSKDVDLRAIGDFFSESVFKEVMKSENFTVLYDLLEKYGDIYEYCEVFYNIDSRKFVKKLIKNGEKPITTAKDTENYMKLANQFWDIKEKYFNEFKE